ncbi:MAG: response regulator, partial [bacterium]|nr:response regulator [bacterium]
MSKARILAVDDQRYFRELLEGLLREEGYEVETVSSAEEALHVLERDTFDVVVTDLVMPGVDGAELVSRIKERLPEQEIVMVTGVVDVKTAVEAMKRGATDYILKPFDRNTLADSLEKILRGRRLKEEHARLLDENLEYMSVLDLYERVTGLYANLSVESLGERLIEGLSLITNAQGGVLWLAETLESKQLILKGVRGIIRIEEEATSLQADDLGPAFESMVDSGHPVLLPRPNQLDGTALFVPLRHGSDLIGLARLTDPVDGGEFGNRRLAACEKFAQHASSALVNALRFHALERRSFRDPNTQAYTHTFFLDATRNEIQKAARFGRAFSLIQVELGSLGGLRRRTSDGEFSGWLVDLVEHIATALRSTDLLAARSDNHYEVLLPETDAVGAAILKQRIRDRVEESDVLSAMAPDLRDELAIAAVTYPTDGTQVETLDEAASARLASDRESPVRKLELRGASFSRVIDRLLEEGTPASAEMSAEATRLLLREVEHRPRERGPLFMSP